MTNRFAGWRDKAIEIAEGIVILTAAGWVMVKPLILGFLREVAAFAHYVAGWWRGLDWGGKRRMLAIAAALVALLYAWSWREVPGHWLAYMKGERPLYAASTWYYQLDKAVVDDLAKRKEDVLVIDYATGGGKIPLTAAEVARLKVRPDGSKRLVIAYMSIGEAEQYRFYFRPEWKTEPPEWLGEENCQWPGAHKVKFWHDWWKDISWRGKQSYLKRIIDAGFDGVYLDRVDIYDQYPERKTAREDMIQYIKDLSATAKKLRPGFLVIPQNADDLLSEPDYRAVIDGLGREDLLFGAHETGKRNPDAEISASQRRLDLLLWEWKPVLAVEYMQTRETIEKVTREMRDRNLVPTVQPRGLDGTDPTAPIDLKKDVGTAEYAKANCEKGKAW